MHSSDCVKDTLLLLAFISLLVSLYSLVFDIEYNKCEMTYMMQPPQYIPIKLPRRMKKDFPQYNLFVYTEGYSEPVSRGQFEGIPVLFIPGNDGSHRQVRSLASVAMQMRARDRSLPRLDFFAVDLNSEMSALHGPFLFRQSEFVQRAVNHIESLYPTRKRFTIALVGHSMGGLVARFVTARDTFDASRVPLIVTLATPHQRPVLDSDWQMSGFYSATNELWRRRRATSLGHVTVVSLGGGERDLEVPLSLTSLDGLTLPRNSLWLPTSHVAGAWASTDHKCIVWCKQVVVAITRALLDSAGSSGFADSVSHFRRRLTSTSSSSRVEEAAAVSDDSEAWYYRDIGNGDAAFAFERERLRRRVFVKIGPLDAAWRRGASLVAVRDGGDASGWVLAACRDVELRRPCRPIGAPLPDSEFPPTGLRRRVVFVDEATVRRLVGDGDGEIFLVAAVGPAAYTTEFQFESYQSSQRTLTFGPLGGTRRLAAGALYHSVTVRHSADGHEASLNSLGCRSLAGSPGGVVQEDSPGRYWHSTQYFNQNCSLSLTATGRLHVITNPQCQYELTIAWRPQALGAAAIRSLGGHLPAWLGLHVALACLQQLLTPDVCLRRQLASPLLILASLAVCLPSCALIGWRELIRQLALAAFSLGASGCALGLIEALLSLLSLGLRVFTCGGVGGQFGGKFASLLTPIGCLLSLYISQMHCGAAAIAFLFTTQLLKTSVTMATSARADGAARIVAHERRLACLLGAATVACGASLVVWAKGLAVGQQRLLPRDPFSLAGSTFSVLCAVDAALLTNRCLAMPPTLTGPVAMATTAAVAAFAVVSLGSCGRTVNLLVLLLLVHTLARLAVRLRRRQKSA